jgi:tetratricopeptide (TPR) repeat protein
MRAVPKATTKRGTPRPLSRASSTAKPPATPTPPVLSRPDLIPLAVLLLITIALFARMLGFESVTIDQKIYGYTNPNLVHGLTLDGLTWAFTSTYNYWQPLAYVSHLIDFQLFGQQLAGHYAVNLFWHLANISSLYILLRYTTGSRWKSAAVAALFALHPIHVEPVAWLASRKDVLSTFFLFLTIAAYLFWVRQPSWQRYALILVAFAAALMTKSTLVVAPLLLLCLDWWPIRRMTNAGQVIPLFIEKLPLFIASAISGAVTIQDYVTTQSETFSYYGRGAHFIPGAKAAGILMRTFYEYLWPVSFSVVYPGLSMSTMLSLAAIACFGGITILFARLGHSFPYLISGWLWTLFAMGPILGVTFGDRFAYVPTIGLSWMLVWGFASAVENFSRPARIAATAAGGVILAALAVKSYVELSYWHDTDVLLRHTIQLYPRMPQPKFWLANTLAVAGRQEESVALYDEGLRMYPQAIMNELDYSRFLYRWGYTQQAIKHYRHILALRKDGQVAKELAEALIATGRPDEALPVYEEVHRLHPEDAGITRIIERIKAGRMR